MSSSFQERLPKGGSAPPDATIPPHMSLATTDWNAALAPEELAWADRVARRLHSESVAFLNGLPAAARNASGLARHLDIDRTTCQRVVFVASRRYPGPELLARVPGVKALQQMTAAARGTKPPIDETLATGLDAAIDQFRELISALGGSQSRLARRLDMTGGGQAAAAPAREPQGDDATARARARLFEVAAELTGRHSECWVAVYVYRPLPGHPEVVELSRAHGLVGHVARPDAVPLTFHNFTTRVEENAGPTAGQFVSLGNEPVTGRTPDSVLLEFTSDPPPVVSSKQPNEYLVQSIDESAATIGRPVDLMLATRTTMPNPALQAPPLEEAWALINFPCRHMLFDIYMHRDLARGCIPSLDVHLWRPDFAQNKGDRWQTRFAEGPTLQLLGPGIRPAAPPEYPRMADLTRHLFAKVGIDPREFIGFRCQVDYPLWRAGYCVNFDFTKAEGAEG